MAKGPDRRLIREIPYTAIAELDKVGDVKAALYMLEQGNFMKAAQLCDLMKRDDRVTGTLSTRVNGLIGAPTKFHPGKETKRGRAIRDLVGGSEEAAGRPGLWHAMFPAAERAQLHEWGINLGIGVGEMVWNTSGTDMGKQWLPRLRIWHPQYVYWRWDTESYWIATREGMIELPRVDEFTHSDGRWIVYCPFGYRRAWLRGLARAAAMPYLLRQWTYRDFARYCEVHGMAIRLAKVPAGAEEEDKDQFYQAIVNAGSEMTVEAPDGGEGNKFGLELIEAKSRSFEAFDMMLQRVEDSLAITYLGHANNASVKGGVHTGATAGAEIRDDLKRMDAICHDEALYAQGLYWWAAYNFGEEWCPRPETMVDPPADEASEAAALKALSDALPNLQAAGADVLQILDTHGIPTLEEEELQAAAEQAQAAPPAVTPEQVEAAIAGAGGDAAKAAAAVAQLFTQPQQQPAPGGVPAPAAAGQRQAAAGAVALGDGPPVRFIDHQGLRVAVETDAGQVRKWGPGPSDETVMRYPYGYLVAPDDGKPMGLQGADGDSLDVLVGPNASAPNAFIVHTHAPPDFTSYDEDKILLGFTNYTEAEAAFKAHYTDPRFMGKLSMMPMDVLKRKLRRRTGSGPIRASALGAAAPRRVVRVQAPLQLGGRPVFGERRAKLYVDRLAVKARLHAQRLMGQDLDAVLGCVRDAASYDDLRGRLAKAFKGMDQQRLAKLTKGALLMAELSGRQDVLAQAVRGRSDGHR